MRRSAGWLGLVAVLLAPACIQKETTSTVYLDPDGQLNWVVVERDVRSDAEASDERDREEAEYVEAVRADRHPVAVAFRALGGRDVRTTWLRDRRPWSAVVEASFDGLDAPWTAALTACGIPHSSAVSTQHGTTTWRLTLQFPEAADTPDCTVIADGLSDAFGGTILLTRGRFVDAVGFEIQAHDRAILVQEALADGEPGREVVLSLSWTAGPQPAGPGQT